MTVNGKKPADSAGSGNGRASDLHDSSPSEGSKTAPAIVPDEPVAKAENPSAAVRRPSTRHRSRITNRNKLLPSISGTSVWARLMRDTMDAMIVHLGGEDQVSETQRTACRRIAVLETELVLRTAALLRGAGMATRAEGHRALAHELPAGQQGRLIPPPKSPISLPWPISPGFFAHLERTDMTIHKMRHMCRNTHCRLKLPTPVENEHHAFCTRSCHAVYYRSRCQVCEAPIRRKTERQLTCFSRKCKSERRRFPAAYSWPEYKTNVGHFLPPSSKRHPLRNSISSPVSRNTSCFSNGDWNTPILAR